MQEKSANLGPTRVINGVCVDACVPAVAQAVLMMGERVMALLGRDYVGNAYFEAVITRSQCEVLTAFLRVANGE